MWLAILFTAIPVGTATGYAYSSLLAESIGWQWAYFMEGILMCPFVVFMFYISPQFPVDHKHHSSSGGAGGEGDEGGVAHHTPTLVEEFGIIFSKPLFLCLTAGYAAQTAMLIGRSVGR